jgi:hypothetical protein
VSIEQLTAVIPPPANPVETGTVEEWADLEQRMGLHFPPDFKDLIAIYGTGYFPAEFRIYNPFSKNYGTSFDEAFSLTESIARNVSEFGIDGPTLEGVDYPFYPRLPGLLMCSHSAGFDGEIFWIASAESADWPVVAASRYIEQPGATILYHCSLTTFLAKFYACELVPPFWDEIRDTAYNERVFVRYPDVR